VTSFRAETRHRCTDRSSRFAQITAERPHTLELVAVHPPSKLPLPWVYLDIHLIHDSLGPSEPKTQTASRSVQPFLHRSMGGPFPTIPRSQKASRPHIMHGSLGSPESTTHRGINQVAHLLQRDRATHELLRFAKL